MRKTLLIVLSFLAAAVLLTGCQGGRTYQCEGAATDIRNAKAYDRAIENMMTYIEGEGATEPCARVMLFWAYAEKGDFTEAVRWRDEAVEMNPACQEEIDSLIIERRFFVKAQNMTIEAMNAGDYQNALDSAIFAQELDPNYYLPYYLAAEVYINLEIEALNAGNEELAAEYGELAAEEYHSAIQKLHEQWKDPDSYYQPVKDNDAMRVYYRGADVLALTEKYDMAQETIDLALERFPDFFEIKMVKADILVRQENNEEAETLYEELIPLAEEKYEDAEGNAKIIAGDDYVNLLDKVGVFYITRNNLDPADLQLAIEYLRTGFEIDPDNATLVDHLNLVLNQLNFTADDADWIRAVFEKWEEQHSE
jgi:tetratricopeptide (TPR) repeat protein